MMNKKPRPSLATIERKFSLFSDTNINLDNTTQLENTKKQSDTSKNKLPNSIKALIKRRCDRLKQPFSPWPHTGQIVLIDAQTIVQHVPQFVAEQHSNPSNDFRLNEPLLVLLDSAEDNGSQWTGWLVTQETDYATAWDRCLEPKPDAPLDPLVGMVQVWNQVSLHTDFIGRVVGELKKERMADINTLAHDYQQQRQQTNVNALSNDDLRHRYQELYQQAAHYLSDASDYLVLENAPINEKDTAPLVLNQWLHTLFLQADQIKRSIVPKINYAMGDGEEKDNDLLLNKSLRIQASRKNLNDGTSYLVKMTIQLENTQNYSIEFFEDDNLEHYFKLSTSEPTTHFMRNPKIEDSELVIRDENETIIHRFFL